MTGSSDGVVRMWSLDFVEVPIIDKDEININTDDPSMQNGQNNIPEKSTNSPTMLQSLTQQLAKKMSLSCESNNDTLKSLQEILAANVYASTPQAQRKNPETMINNAQSEEDPSSDTENCENQGDDTLDNATDEEVEDMAENRSIYENNCPNDYETNPSKEKGEDMTDGNEIHKTNLDTAQTSNIASDFVVVSNDEITQDEESDPDSKDDNVDQDKYYGNAYGSCGGRRRRRRLESDGYTWSRQLVFRAKLTMHTAFERPDNVDPAAVTALAVSKDHRTVYVGDEKGRVFSWSVSSRPGKGKITAKGWNS